MHERWFDADGRWVHTADWEPARVRTGAVPVLLVHGLGASTLSWEPVGAALADRLGTRVTALDLPGFGRSRARQPATMSSHRAAVTALLRGPRRGDRDGQLDGRGDCRRRRRPPPGARARARAGERGVPSSRARTSTSSRARRASPRSPFPRSRHPSCGLARNGSVPSGSSTPRSGSCTPSRIASTPHCVSDSWPSRSSGAPTPKRRGPTPRAAHRCSGTSRPGCGATSTPSARRPSCCTDDGTASSPSPSPGRSRRGDRTGATSSWPTAATRHSSSCPTRFVDVVTGWADRELPDRAARA